MAEIFADSLFDALVDSLKVVPILFIAYLLVALLSHDHSHKLNSFLSKNKKTSVFYASFLGCVPQCGFSSVMSDLYSRKHVSLGTLIAVFIATSDEAIPIMLTDTSRILDLLLLIGIKIVLAIVWGYAIDLIINLSLKKKSVKTPKESLKSHEEHEHDHKHEEHCHEHHESNLEHHLECGHIHTEECGHDCGDHCANNIFFDAVIHTFNIAVYIFIATFALNLIISCIDMQAVSNFLNTNIYLQIILASLVGLIPNCASSVLLVELFFVNILSFPALVAGLTSGAGVGLIILWTKNRHKPLQNLGIMFLQYAIGVLSGFFLTIFFH